MRERLKKEESPACVEICSSKAIRFVSFDKLSDEERKRNDKYEKCLKERKRLLEINKILFEYKIISEKCNKCGICYKICPFEAIKDISSKYKTNGSKLIFEKKC